MRKAQLFYSGNLLTQLIIAGVIVIVVWTAFANDSFNGERYKQTTYAVDNALVLETLMAVPTGTMEAAYLLTDQDYTMTVSNGRLRVENAEEGGIDIVEPFATSQGVQVLERTFTPSLYQYVKTPTTLGVDVVTGADDCPVPAQTPPWDERPVLASGDPEAAQILETALLGIAEVEYHERMRDEPRSSALEYLVGEGEGVMIAHGPHLETSSLACLLLQEFRDAGLTADTRIATGRGLNDGISITVPQNTNKVAVRDAAVCAYKRLTRPEVHERGCE